MMALCQFCHIIIVGPVSAEPDSSPERAAFAYSKLAQLVAWHMSDKHEAEVGQQITMAMALAGAAVAMRYVSSGDARLDSERIAAADQLIAALQPVPVAPLVALVEAVGVEGAG